MVAAAYSEPRRAGVFSGRAVHNTTHRPLPLPRGVPPLSWGPVAQLEARPDSDPRPPATAAASLLYSERQYPIYNPGERAGRT
jgi:hypothetical protein